MKKFVFLFLAVVLASYATMQEDVYVENLSENSELSVFEMAADQRGSMQYFQADFADRKSVV